MKLTIICTQTRIKHRDKRDSERSYKNQKGDHSATLSQSIVIDVPDKINGKWKRIVTDMLHRYDAQLRKNERPVVHIGDNGLKVQDRCVTFSFRNIPFFANDMANYILQKRRSDRDRIGRPITPESLKRLAEAFKHK